MKKQYLYYILCAVACCVMLILYNIQNGLTIPTNFHIGQSSLPHMPRSMPLRTNEEDIMVPNNNIDKTRQSNELSDGNNNKDTNPKPSKGSHRAQPTVPEPTVTEPTVTEPVEVGIQRNSENQDGVVDCQRPWVTSLLSGRLGNRICYLATMAVLHREYGIQVGLRYKYYHKLKQYFPKMTTKLLPQECIQTGMLERYRLDEVEKMLSSGSSINGPMLVGLPCNLSKLWPYRSFLRKELTYQQKAQVTAKERLQIAISEWQEKNRNRAKEEMGRVTNEPAKETAAPLVVGVHVRRTDFERFLIKQTGYGSLPGVSYFEKAFSYYRNKYGRVLFVVSSDDRHWCIDNLEKQNSDVVVPIGSSPLQDMALLSEANHSIISMGTFGIWSSLLGHGTVVYPNFVDPSRKTYYMKYMWPYVKFPDIIEIPIPE